MGHGHSRTEMSVGKSPDLVQIIRDDQFFTVDESQLLQAIGIAFESELGRLQLAPVSEKPVDAELELVDSPSRILFGQDYDEVNRTLTGLLCLRWIWNDEYSRFTASQPQNSRLTMGSFKWLHDYLHHNLRSPEDILPLIVSMVINDLGKDPNLKLEIAEHFNSCGKDLPEQNHDSLLYEAASIPGLIKCLDLLDASQRKDVILGLELGSELNAGQLAQAESVPINLEFLRDMQGQEHAFELKFMEQVMDVAGARGHLNSNGSVTFTQPVFETFHTVHDVSLRVIKDDLPLREAYDHVLKRRERILVDVGFRRLSVSRNEDRALLRLLTMGRTADIDQAELFAEAFEQLEDDSRRCLITGLNIDGNDNEQAVLPYYMPAVLAETMNTTKDWSENDRRRALTSVMRYLAKVFDQSPKVLVFNDIPEDECSPKRSTVVEHNMLPIKDFIHGESFAQNPDSLNELDIPQGQQLPRRRTSTSLASSESLSFGRAPSRTNTGFSTMSAQSIEE